MARSIAQSGPMFAGAGTTTSRRPGLVPFIVIVYAITWGIFLVAFLGMQAGVLTGAGTLEEVLIQIGAAAPLIAALAVLGATRGRAGVIALGRTVVRWRIHPSWYAFTLLGVPALLISVMAVLNGDIVGVLAARGPGLLAQLPLFVLSTAIFTGLAEEPGWRGFALPAANTRSRPMVAALVVSVVWALWHLPNALFGFTGFDALAGHLLVTVMSGLVYAWVFNSTGSVLIVMLLHGVLNTTTTLLAQASAETGVAAPLPQVYAVSAGTLGALVLVVAAATHGRLRSGSPAAAEA